MRNWPPIVGARRRFVLALVAAGLCVPAPGAQALGVGDRAPSFQAPRLEGEGALGLASFRGQVLYVDFWASWCGPCATSLPALEALRREFADQGFAVLAINVDKDPAKARRFLASRPVGYPSVSDPEGRLPATFGLQTMPTSYLIDRAGVIRHVHQGFRPDDVEALRQRIRELVEAPR